MIDVKAGIGSIAVILVFFFVLFGLLVHTGDPLKYLASPVTIITIVVLSLALIGALKLNIWLILLLVGLMILVMYQDDLYRLIDDLKDTFELFKKEVSKPGENEKVAVIAKFKSLYADKVSENEFYVYMKQVDDSLREAVGRFDFDDGTFFNNYYVVVLPEIISVDSGRPLGDTTSEKITLWAVRHVVEVPIVHNGKLYTVRAKAYLIKKKITEELPSWAYALNAVAAIFDSFSGHPGKKHIKGVKYADFVQYLEEHSYNLPDKLYFKGVW